MLSREFECKWGHTPISPGKNGIRNECYWSIPPDKDLITISPAGLSEINTVRWNVPTERQGRILVVDCDLHAVLIARRIRLGDPKHSKPGEYPRLRYLPEQLGNIQEVIPNYYLPKFGVCDLGGIELDLTGTVKPVAAVAKPIVDAICEYHNRHGIQLFVTFRNGRDEVRNASDERVAYLIRQLVGVRYNWHRCYRSERRNEKLRRVFGSSMTCVAFKF